MTQLSGINGNTVESDVIRSGKCVSGVLVPTLCVGTRVLDALRHVGCHARSRHEATPSVEEGIPTPERGNEKMRNAGGQEGEGDRMRDPVIRE